MIAFQILTHLSGSSSSMGLYIEGGGLPSDDDFNTAIEVAEDSKAKSNSAVSSSSNSIASCQFIANSIGTQIVIFPNIHPPVIIGCNFERNFKIGDVCT